MVKLPVEQPRNQHFPVTPTNIRILEITPSSRASNYGKWLCAHFLLFENVSFYEERMYFLYDTHHGTVFSTFSSVSRLKMEMKTCQFGAILDSATRSTS